MVKGLWVDSGTVSDLVHCVKLVRVRQQTAAMYHESKSLGSSISGLTITSPAHDLIGQSIISANKNLQFVVHSLYNGLRCKDDTIRD